MHNKKYFSFTGLYQQFSIISIIVDLIKDYNLIYKIHNVIGTFPNFIWGGLYENKGISVSLENIKRNISFYNERNIIVTLDLVNPLIQKKHLDDYYCNSILELLRGGNNGIILSSPILYKYIIENYPELDISVLILNNEDMISDILQIDNVKLVYCKKSTNNLENFNYLGFFLNGFDNKNDIERMYKVGKNNLEYEYQGIVQNEWSNIKLDKKDIFKIDTHNYDGIILYTYNLHLSDLIRTFSDLILDCNEKLNYIKSIYTELDKIS